MNLPSFRWNSWWPPFMPTSLSPAGHLQFPSPSPRLRISRDVPYQGELPPEPLPYCPGFILPSSIYSDTVGVLGLKTSQWLPLFPYYWSLWERSCACCRGKIHSTGSKVQGRCVWRQSTFFPYCYHFSFFFVLFFLILLSLAFLRQMGLRNKNIRNKTIIVITIKKRSKVCSLFIMQ